MSNLPSKNDALLSECQSDIILKNLFPKVKAALFDVDEKYVTPGNTLFHCHFCKINSDNESDFKVHLETEDHEENISKRRIYLSELTESFYTAVQTKSVDLQKKNATFNVCAKCLMPYFEGAKKHRMKEEHNYSVGMIRPGCRKCDRLFSTRIDQEIHQVTLDHIYSALAYDRWKSVAGSKKVALLDEYNPDVPVGMEYVRHTTAFFCRPCGKNFKKDEETLKEHCNEESHIEKAKEFAEKLKPLRMAHLAEVEKKKASKANAEKEGDESKANVKKEANEDQESDEHEEAEEMAVDDE